MKKIIDFFVAAYFSIGNKEYESSLEKGLIVLNIPFVIFVLLFFAILLFHTNCR